MAKITDEQRTLAQKLVKELPSALVRNKLIEAGCTKSQANNLIKSARKKAGLYMGTPKTVANEVTESKTA